MLNNRALLMERYPEIGFMFNCLPFEPFTLFTDQDGRPNAKRGDFILQDPKEKLDVSLDGVDILYLFGVGLGRAYIELKEWLHAKRGRMIVFLEEDLAVIDALMEQECAAELLEDPSVHIRFIPDRSGWELAIEELAHTFISDRIACRVLKSYRKDHGRRLKKIELKLMRATAALHALLSESLHAQKIFANLYPNFLRLPKAFYVNDWKGKFQGVPAVICGAGPSLKGALPTLKKLEEKAVIIAGGSTITALSRQGIEPHLGMALDPNPDEYERLRPSTAFEMPLLYANRVLPDVFATCNGPLGYMRSDTGGLAEIWLEEKLGIEGESIGPDLGREAFSVTTMAVALAAAMGCSPIILVGVDLAYTGMQRYAEGVLETANQVKLSQMKEEKRLTERLLKRKDRHGNTVYTLLKWVMESTCIGNFAKAHPECQFINATDGGIGFPNIPYQSIEEVAAAHCKKSYNLRGKIHAEAVNTRITHIDKEKLESLFAELKSSLDRQLSLSEEILNEKTGRRAALEFDFVEEPSFECFLQPLGPALDRLLNRYFPPEEHDSAKWKEIHSVIGQYLEILK